MMEAFVLLIWLFSYLCLSPWDLALLSTGQEDQCRPSTPPAAFPEVKAGSLLTKSNFLCSPVGNQWRNNGIVSLFSRQKLKGSALRGSFHWAVQSSTPELHALGAQVLQHRPNFSQSQHVTGTAYFKSEPAMTLPQQKPSECSTMAHYGLSRVQNTPHHIPNQALH